MYSFTESTIEQAAIDWLQELGYNYAFNPEIAFNVAVRMVSRWMDYDGTQNK